MNQDIKSIKIVSAALIIGVVFFLIISVFLNQSVGSLQEDDSMETILLFVAAVFAVSSIYVGIFIFNKKMKELNTDDLSGKLANYRTAIIIRAATQEGPAFLFIVCNLLFGSVVFLLEAIAVLAVMIYFFPSNERIAREINHDLRELE